MCILVCDRHSNQWQSIKIRNIEILLPAHPSPQHTPLTTPVNTRPQTVVLCWGWSSQLTLRTCQGFHERRNMMVHIKAAVGGESISKCIKFSHQSPSICFSLVDVDAFSLREPSRPENDRQHRLAELPGSEVARYDIILLSTEYCTLFLSSELLILLETWCPILPITSREY